MTDSYVDKIMEREVDDDIKKAHLAMVLVQLFDRATLEDVLKTLQRKPRNKKGAPV